MPLFSQAAGRGMGAINQVFRDQTDSLVLRQLWQGQGCLQQLADIGHRQGWQHFEPKPLPIVKTTKSQTLSASIRRSTPLTAPRSSRG